VFDHR
jgi:hypothetical protein